MTVPTRSPLGTATLARSWLIDTLIADVWTPVCGVVQLIPQAPIVTEPLEFLAGDSWAYPVKTGRSWTIALTVARKTTRDASPVYDPGQEFLRAAVEDDWGSVHVRWYKMDGINVEAYEGDALVDWAPNGGSRTDLDMVQIALTGQGARTLITHPATA